VSATLICARGRAPILGSGRGGALRRALSTMQPTCMTEAVSPRRDVMSASLGVGI
jgi:hypothetical protein